MFSELLTGASQCSASTFQLPSSNLKKLDKEQGPLQQGFFTALTLDGRRYRQAFRMISQLLDDNVQQPLQQMGGGATNTTILRRVFCG